MNDIPNGFDGRPETALKLEMSDKIDQIGPALLMVQRAVHGVSKSVENTYFNSKYADLYGYIEATRDLLVDNGLVLTQYPTIINGSAALVTLLLHAPSSQWLRGIVPLKPDKSGPQPFGSEVSYMRRYSYAGILGLAQFDDDAETATFRMSKQVETKIRKTLDQAMENGDHDAALDAWLALDDDQKHYLWNGMSDRFYKQKLNKFLKEAQDKRDNAIDPNYIEPLPRKDTEKDKRRKEVRGE